MAVTTERPQPHAPPADRRLRYRADIQGLRAIAVLAVIADHLAGWPRGSFDGVDIFFVISGYLITGILVREFESRKTISFLGFYARRIKRILPAGLFVIGATLCATRVLAGIDRYHFAAKDAIAAVFFAANWRFAHTGVNYFNQALPPSPLQHYWSLSVEEQFYFVWPWLMLGLLLIGLRLRFWRHEQARLVAGVAIVVLSGVSLWLAFVQTSSNPTVAYFSTFDRAWELGLGALIAVAARPLERFDRRLRLVVALAGLVGILVSLFVVRSSPGFPAPWALLPTLSTAAVLGAGAGLTSRSLMPLTNPASQYLGNTSYGLYLWHFPVVVLIVAVFPQYSAAYWIVGLALIFGLSAASFHLLEDPARRGTWFRPLGRLQRPRRLAQIASACAATALSRRRPARCERPSRPDSCCRRPSWSVIPRTIPATAWAPRRSTRAITVRRCVRRADVRMAPPRAVSELPRTAPDSARPRSQSLRDRDRDRAASVTSSVAQHLAAIRPVAATGARIVVVEDNPGVSPASTACVDRVTYSATGDCGTSSSFAYQDPDLLARAAERIPGAVVIPTRQYYCRGDFCPATIGNVIVYRDTAAHVTASYARTVSPYLVEAIERAVHARTD